MTSDKLLGYLILKGQAWVATQRDLHRPSSEPLDPTIGAAMAPFFGADVIASARIKEVSEIAAPGFYSELTAIGAPIPLDFRSMEGITYGDTVLLTKSLLSASRPQLGLIFHELVHVVQYRLLGIDSFIDRYLHGWVENGMDYYAIPLERDAYRLQARYQSNPLQPFSVRDEVAQRLNSP